LLLTAAFYFFWFSHRIVLRSFRSFFVNRVDQN